MPFASECFANFECNLKGTPANKAAEEAWQCQKQEFARSKADKRGSKFEVVSDELIRGPEPKPEDFQTLKQLGVKTIVDLRLNKNDAAREEALAKKAGIDYLHIPVGCSAPDDETIRKFLDLVADPAKQPVFVHCWQGVDRTGMFVALYRRTAQDWTFDQAYKEMRDHHYKWYLPFLRSFKKTVETFPQGWPKVARGASEDCLNGIVVR
jgi:uncharacterized protein (TIGR01244 family)